MRTFGSGLEHQAPSGEIPALQGGEDVNWKIVGARDIHGTRPRIAAADESGNGQSLTLFRGTHALLDLRSVDLARAFVDGTGGPGAGIPNRRPLDW